MFSGGGLPLLFFSQFFQDKLNVKRCAGRVKLNVVSGFSMVRDEGFEPTNPCGTGASGLRIQGLWIGLFDLAWQLGPRPASDRCRLPRFQAPPHISAALWEGPNLVFHDSTRSGCRGGLWVLIVLSPSGARFPKNSRKAGIHDAFCQDWYPLFGGCFLSGTIFDDFSF